MKRVLSLAATILGTWVSFSGHAQTTPLITQILTNETVPEGGTATFTVMAQGTAPLYYLWSYNGIPLPNQTGNILTISPADLTNSGTYRVAVSNGYGTPPSSTAVLNVGYAPAIITQPQSQAVLVGENTTLNVEATGSGPLTYQWRLNGANIPNNVIYTIAGNGTSGYSGDGGLASNAMINQPAGLAVDGAGNVYICDRANSLIRKVSAAGNISTIAGVFPHASFSGDGGPATNAWLSQPYGIAVDPNGNVYIADSSNNRIRKISTSGIITTVAGTNINGYTGDSRPAANAGLDQPRGIWADADGNLLIADSGDYRIRLVVYGSIYTVAGNGSQGFLGDGGLATGARLNFPTSVALDGSGNIFIGDTQNYRVRKVDENDIITTVAGTNGPGYSGDGGLAVNAVLSAQDTATVDAAGNIYIADSVNNRVRLVWTNGIITTLAGGGQSTAEGALATNANLSAPYAVTVDNYGNVIIADTSHNRVRKVTVQGPAFLVTNVNYTATNYDVVISNSFGSVTSTAANISSVFLPGITVAPQSQVVASGVNASFTITGNGTPPLYYQWYFNGNLIAHQTNTSFTVTNSSSNSAGIYQAAVGNNYGWVTSPEAGLTVTLPTLQKTGKPVAGGTVSLTMTTFGPPPLYYQWQLNGSNLPTSTVITFAGGGTNSPTNGGPATNVALQAPGPLALDGAGNLYVGEVNGYRVDKIDANGMISVVAGSGKYGTGGDGGPATNAFLGNIYAITLDAAGNLYLTDNYNSKVHKVSPNGLMTLFAGKGSSGFSGDGGPATNALLNTPDGLAADAAGDIFISDMMNNRIRMVDTNGIITTVAGSINGFTGDGGLALNARLTQPRGLWVDPSGNLFIADGGNNRIREIGANSLILTVAGNGASGYSGDGVLATNASIYLPYDVYADKFGNMFIADYNNSRLREAEVGGNITTVSGATSLGAVGGVVEDSSGNVFCTEAAYNRVRKFSFQGSNLVLTNLPAGDGGNYAAFATGNRGTSISSPISFYAPLAPQNISAAAHTDQIVQVSFSGSPTNSYVLQTTTNLADPAQWISVATNLADTNGNWNYFQTNATEAARFYRATLP